MNPPSERPWVSISIDYLSLPPTSRGHVSVVYIQDDSSRSGIFIPVPDVSVGSTAYHLLLKVMLQFGKPNVIRSDQGPGFVGEVVQWVLQIEGIMREFSAPYHPQSMGLVERSNQTIQDSLNKMDIGTNWDLYLQLAQCPYTTLPRAMYHAMTSYEVVNGFKPPEFARFAGNPSIPEHMIKSFDDYDILSQGCYSLPY